MRIKEGQIFNLMDTNGRRNDVINALQGYLTILDDIQNEQKMNWASMPESLAQYEFYRQAIELSPEVFGKQKFTNEELRLLIDSLLFSKHIPYSQAKKLITKLESLSNIYFKSRSQYIYPLPVDRTDNKQVFYNISILDEAIRKKQKVLFEYAEYHTDKKMHLKKREDGSVREYVVTPYQMAAQEGKYYLICNYDKYDDISNYRVDRIRNIQILEEKGKPFETLKWSGHQPMNLNEYMKEHVYMYSSENAFVKFRIVKAMISDVIDLFGKGVKFSEETDTHVSVSVHVNERAAEQFAKNYAPDVVILQPKRLRDKLRDDLKKAWEAYED